MLLPSIKCPCRTGLISIWSYPFRTIQESIVSFMSSLVTCSIDLIFLFAFLNPVTSVKQKSWVTFYFSNPKYADFVKNLFLVCPVRIWCWGEVLSPLHFRQCFQNYWKYMYQILWLVTCQLNINKMYFWVF